MRKILVMSGKGGVGKTTCSASLAAALSNKGYTTGIVDIDLTGSNIPQIFNINSSPEFKNDQIIPPQINNLKILSIDFLLPGDSPLLWDEKQLSEATIHLIERTKWDCDYLVIDSPPGTENEIQAIAKNLKVDGCIIITIPSKLAESDARKTIELCRRFQLPILGYIKNFSTLICDVCGKEHKIFKDEFQLPIPCLGEIPFQDLNNGLLKNFPVDKILESLDNPIILERRERKSLKKEILKGIVKWLK